MKCPYCRSEVDDEAAVCKVCTRDLYLFKPFTQKIAQLEEKLQAQQDREGLLLRISELEGLLLQAHDAAHEQPLRWGRTLMDLGQCFVIPLLLLLLGHALVTVVYDLPLLYLRVISIALPLPFGYWLFSQRRRLLLPWFVVVAALAATSVIGMSAITAWVDRVPVMPQNTVEWKEFIEYAASISFSFLTGMLLGGMALYRSRQRLVRAAVPTFHALLNKIAQGQLTAATLQDLFKKIEGLGSTAMALGTTAMSVYTGLKAVL